MSFELFEGHRPDFSSARRIERDREQLTDVLNAAPKTASKALGFALPLGVLGRERRPLTEPWTKPHKAPWLR